MATYYEALSRCSNFHILLTTRIETYSQARSKKINSLSIDTAKKLFAKYYPRIEEEGYKNFDKLYEAINGNILVLELLSKQLFEVNKLRHKKSLAALILSIQTKGILALEENKKVPLQYQKYKTASPEEVISALYE